MKKRIISAAIMIAILVPLVIIGGIPFRILVGIIGILGYKEFIDLKGKDKYPMSVICIGLIVLLLLVYSNKDILFASSGLDYRYLACAFILMFTPTLFYYGTDKYTFKDAFNLTAFVSFFGITLNLLSNILIYSKPYFWMLLLVTIITDTFAYATGVAIGKHKFSKISPNKTIEGCIGGLFMGCTLATIYYSTFIRVAPIYKVIFVMLILSIACEVGDLFYSLIKREVGIKDFSKLIPGHGGVLDRIDSLTFVTLAYVLLMGII